MGRREYAMEPRGSRRWLQLAVNRRPETLNDEFRRELDLLPDERVTWRSPLESDDFAEYRDGSLLTRLGVGLRQRRLRDFWPSACPARARLTRCAP